MDKVQNKENESGKFDEYVIRQHIMEAHNGFQWSGLNKIYQLTHAITAIAMIMYNQKKE